MDESTKLYDEVSVATKEAIEMKECPCYETPRQHTVWENTGKSSMKDYSSNHKKSLICTLVSQYITIAILIATCVCLVFAFIEIFKLKSEIASIQQMLPPVNYSASQLSQASDELKEIIENNTQQLNSSIKTINSQLNSQLSQASDELKEIIENNTQQLNSSIETINSQLNSQLSQASEELKEIIKNNTQQLNSSIETINSQLNQKYLTLENNTQQLFNVLWSPGQYYYPTGSCAAIFLHNPSSPSGHYWVRSSNGSAVRVYCDMTRSCGNITGGWMRVVELDMTNSSTQCPSGLRQRNDSNLRTCIKNSDSVGCSSVTFFTTNTFSRVCGKIKGYQFGHPDAFRPPTSNIDDHYVDGISLTHGRPRQHIWTFAVATDEAASSPLYKCSCSDINITSSVTPPPAFVGNDYFCDAGTTRFMNFILYSDNPLWDGVGCGSRSTCCTFNNPPWFYKQLSQPTSDDIEMRVCRNEAASDEDIAIEIIDIYIQ